MSTAPATPDPLRYPIGPARMEDDLTAEKRLELITPIAELPQQVRAAVASMSDAQLDTPYREGGWTVRTLVHHIADSHLNAYVRFKLALTEDSPTIKPYDENLWADLPDSKLPVELSLGIIDGVHARWAAVLRAMKQEDFGRKLNHPERGLLSLDQMLSLYAWHSRHHLAHITNLKQRQGW